MLSICFETQNWRLVFSFPSWGSPVRTRSPAPVEPLDYKGISVLPSAFWEGRNRNGTAPKSTHLTDSTQNPPRVGSRDVLFLAADFESCRKREKTTGWPESFDGHTPNEGRNLKTGLSAGRGVA